MLLFLLLVIIRVIGLVVEERYFGSILHLQALSFEVNVWGLVLRLLLLGLAGALNGIAHSREG